nr:MAG TPA: hypothetical protein [Caudoviricetes sp.]
MQCGLWTKTHCTSPHFTTTSHTSTLSVKN